MLIIAFSVFSYFFISSTSIYCRLQEETICNPLIFMLSDVYLLNLGWLVFYLLVDVSTAQFFLEL